MNDNDLHQVPEALVAPCVQTVAECHGSPVPDAEAPSAPADGKTAERKTGAPKGNINGFRHGLRQGGRRLLIIGSLPAGHRWAERIIDRLRVEWEQHVIAAKGRLSRADEETIQSAIRWERHAVLATCWLRKGFDTLTADQRLAFSREIAEASEKRDRKLRMLGIDAADGNPWDSLDNAKLAAEQEKATSHERSPSD